MSTLCLCLLRARPVISTNLTLEINPQVLNLEDKTCQLPGTTTAVTWYGHIHVYREKGDITLVNV